MARYAETNSDGGTQQAMSGTYKTLLSLTAEATPGPVVSGKIYDLLMGTTGTPADNYMEYDLSKQTAAGTATAITSVLLDAQNGAARLLPEGNYTAEGTITANSSGFYVGVNQRASYRWVAAPGGEFIVPATDELGWAFRARSVSGYTGTASVTMHHEE